MLFRISPFLILLCFSDPPSLAQATSHATEWANRRAAYIAHPRIARTGSSIEISTNSPRPLDQVIGALSSGYGWHVNYEDPQYSASDLVDDTAPSWLKEHPNGPRVYNPAGGAFTVTIPFAVPDAKHSPDPTRVLPAVVSAYNRTTNPGRFELRNAGDGTFDVVPVSKDPREIAVLDTMMDFEAEMGPSVGSILGEFCAELQRQSGKRVTFSGFGVAAQVLIQETVAVHVHQQPAREILRQILKQLGQSIVWDVIYDPDSSGFLVLLRRTA